MQPKLACNLLISLIFRIFAADGNISVELFMEMKR